MRELHVSCILTYGDLKHPSCRPAYGDRKKKSQCDGAVMRYQSRNFNASQKSADPQLGGEEKTGGRQYFWEVNCAKTLIILFWFFFAIIGLINASAWSLHS